MAEIVVSFAPFGWGPLIVSTMSTTFHLCLNDFKTLVMHTHSLEFHDVVLEGHFRHTPAVASLWPGWGDTCALFTSGYANVRNPDCSITQFYVI